jgi:hypothetical protein
MAVAHPRCLFVLKGLWISAVIRMKVRLKAGGDGDLTKPLDLKRASLLPPTLLCRPR